MNNSTKPCEYSETCAWKNKEDLGLCYMSHCEEYKPTDKFAPNKDSISRFIELRKKYEKKGPFERYMDDMVKYLTDKFPNESEAVIFEAAAFISSRASITLGDLMRDHDKQITRSLQRMSDYEKQITRSLQRTRRDVRED